MKNALITGVGRRLGNAVAHHLLDLDYQVHGHYRTENDAIESLRQRGAQLYPADLTDAPATLAMAECLADLPHLDFVLHNASCFRPEPDDLADKAAWVQECFQVHVQAPLVINEAIYPALCRSTDDPNVVHVTDIFAERPDPQYRSYTAAKAGLDNLALSYAQLWAPRVRVNRLQPGPILFLPEHSAEHKAKVLAHTLLQREGGLEPVLDALDLLRTNAYLTGAVIKVDGGRFLAE